MANLAAAFDVLTKGADKAANDMDRVGNSSERTGHKVEKAGGSMRLMASTFVGASNQALGPLQEIANKFDLIEQASANASSKAGGRLLGIGAAGLGAGTFLATLASREKQGEQQLRASIEAVGGSYDDFATRIDGAVKAGEHFGNQNSTTLDALNRLTLTTHSPTEALKDLATAQDVAAAKHVPLQKAAEIVGLIFNGSTRAGKQFGLQLENVGASAKTLATAQNAVKTSNDRVSAAQQSYNDKLAVYQQTLKPTLGQQQALFRAHQNVTAAQHDAADAASRLKDAQEKAGGAAEAGARNVQKLADITKGQGEGAADSFAGHMRALGARVEDTAGQIGQKYGSAISAFSIGTIAVGSLVESGLIPKLGGLISKLGSTSGAFRSLAATEVTTSAEGALAVEAGAAKAEAAMAAEGDAAVVLGTKLKATIGIAGALGSLALLGPGLVPDLHSTAPGGLSDRQLKLFSDALNLTSKSRTELLGASKDDLAAVLAHLDPKSQDSGIVAARTLLTALTAQQAANDNSFANKTAEDLAAKHAAAGNRQRSTAPGAKATDPTLQGFLDSIGAGKAANAQLAAAAADAAKAAKQAAIDSATAIRDSLRTQFDAAKSILTEAVSQAKQLRESIAGSLLQGAQITDVFGTGPNLNANHAFGNGQDFASVKRFFEDRLTKLKRFAAELSALVHKGLDPAIVAQIAQAGLDSGGRLADALSGASKAELGQVNSLDRQVNQIADSSGKRISDVQFRAQIAADKKNTDILGKKLDEANRHLRAISREKPSSAVDQRAAAFLTGT